MTEKPIRGSAPFVPAAAPPEPASTPPTTPEQSSPSGADAPREYPDGKPVELGAHGLALPNEGERGGGAIANELIPEPPEAATRDPLKLQRRYIASRLASEAGNIIGRAPDNIGLWGKGDTYRGVGILVNIDTLEKVRVYDGWKFETDEVFANSRDLPQALVDGDVTKNLSGTA